MEVKNGALRYCLRLCIIVFLTVLLINSTTVLGVENHVSEDFSSNHYNWNLKSVDFSSGDQVPVVTQASITEGELVFGGVSNTWIMDSASLEDQLVFGSWSFDVFHPSTTQNHELYMFTWNIVLSSLEMGTETSYPNWAVYFDIGKIIIAAFDGTPDKIFDNRLKFVDEQILDSYQHIDIIRSPDSIYVYMDGTLFFKIPCDESIGQDSKYFQFTSVRGSGIRFDNLEISSDYLGKLGELNDNSSGLPNVDSNLIMYAIAGSAFIIAISLGVLIFRNRLQKKRFNHLIEKKFQSVYSKFDLVNSHLKIESDLYLFLLSQKKLRKEHGIGDDELDSMLMTELQKYRHILQPHKLTIIKLLCGEHKVASLEIKERLNLTWSELHNSIISLEKEKMIEIFHDFDNTGSKRQFIRLNEKAFDEYVYLIKLIDSFVYRAKDLLPYISSDLLYPEPEEQQEQE